MKVPALFLVTIIFISCTKQNSPSVLDPSMSVDSSAIHLNNEFNYIDSFTINYEGSWSISIPPADTVWMKVSPLSGTGNTKVYVKAPLLNTTGFIRSSTITITPDGNPDDAVAVAVTHDMYVAEKWQKLFGGSSDDNFISVIYYSYGYLLVGNTTSNDGDITGYHGGGDILAVRLNSAGEIIWKRTYGGSGIDEAKEVVEGYGGEVIIVGKTTSNDGDVTGGAQGSDDGWILGIYGVDGTITRQKTVGSGISESFFSIVRVGDGFSLSGVKGTDAWVYKMKLDYELVWEHTYGSMGNEMAISIVQTENETMIVTGYTDVMIADGDIPATHGMLDVWVFKLDKDGLIQWSKTFGGSGMDFPWKAVTSTAYPTPYKFGAIITGYTTSNDGDVTNNHGGQDAWVIRVDGDGNLEWQKTYGGSGTDDLTYITPIQGVNLVQLAGYTSSSDGDITKNQGGTDAWYLYLGSSGEIFWQKTFGGSGNDIGTGILQAYDGDFVGVGFSGSNDGDVTGNHGASDAWLLKF